MANLPLRVLSPCDVPASELEPGEGSSYCRRCETPVHDLRNVSETRARALGLLYGQRFCGRIALAAVVATASCATVEPAAPTVDIEPIETARPVAPVVAKTAAATASAAPKPEERRVVISESMGFIVMEKVQFDPQGAVPPPESRPILDETAKVLLANPDLIPLLRVEGHADSRERAPDALTKRRAEEVVAYLVAKGVPPDRLVAAAQGANKPIADNATAEGRAKNRRIEFHIVR